MRQPLQSNFLIALIAILGFVFSYYPAFADYVAFQNKIEHGVTVGTSGYGTSGGGSGVYFGFRYDATSTVTQFDRVDIPMCHSTSNTGGTMYLEVRTTATTGPIVASSSLAINSGNFVTCPIGVYNATTTTFVLNQNIQWVNGVQMFFLFRGIGHDGTMYVSIKDEGSTDVGPYTFYGADLGPYWFSPNYYNVFVTGRGLGLQPTIQNIYNSSSTPVICNTFDVGCYVSNAFAWAFILPENSFSQFETLKDDIKYRAPFGYFTSAYSAIASLSATGTPEFTLATSSPIMALVFTPFRNGLLWLILFAGLFWLYKRLTEIIP